MQRVFLCTHVCSYNHMWCYNLVPSPDYSSWKPQMYQSCTPFHGKPFSTLKEAQAVCLLFKWACAGVLTESCNGHGGYYICRSKPFVTKTRSCVYTPLNKGLFALAGSRLVGLWSSYSLGTGFVTGTANGVIDCLSRAYLGYHFTSLLHCVSLFARFIWRSFDYCLPPSLIVRYLLLVLFLDDSLVYCMVR